MNKKKSTKTKKEQEPILNQLTLIIFITILTMLITAFIIISSRDTILERINEKTCQNYNTINIINQTYYTNYNQPTCLEACHHAFKRIARDENVIGIGDFFPETDCPRYCENKTR